MSILRGKPDDPDEFFARTGVRLEDAERLDASRLTPEVVRPWMAPRRGRTNPEPMTNPYWEWLVRTRLSADQARQRFAPDFDEAQPHWCFDRVGQPIVALPDGRRLFLAGEHEDHYDPDFHIYNDVVVEGPLPAAMVTALTDDLCRKLARLHGAPFEALLLSTPPP